MRNLLLLRSAILAVLTITLFMICAPGAFAQSWDGLLCSYTFDGNLLDQSGNGLNGIAGTGLSYVTDRYGNTHHALALDGINDYVQISDPNSLLKVTDAITIALWLRVRTLSPMYQNILSDHAPNEGEVGPGKLLRLARNDLEFIVGGVYGWGEAVFAHQTLNLGDLNRWIFVVATYDRVAAKLYIDGKLVDSVPYTQPLIVNPNSMLIGKSGFGEFFRGAIDDLMIYNRALTADEVRQAHYYSLLIVR